MRFVLALLLACALLGCQTKRQSLIVGGVGFGVAAVSGGIYYSARNDEEAPVILAFPLMAGLIVAAAAGVNYIVLELED